MHAHVQSLTSSIAWCRSLFSGWQRMIHGANVRGQRQLVLFAAIVLALLVLVLEFWPQILRWIEGHLNWLD